MHNSQRDRFKFLHVVLILEEGMTKKRTGVYWHNFKMFFNGKSAEKNTVADKVVCLCMTP